MFTTRSLWLTETRNDKIHNSDNLKFAHVATQKTATPWIVIIYQLDEASHYAEMNAKCTTKYSPNINQNRNLNNPDLLVAWRLCQKDMSRLARVPVLCLAWSIFLQIIFCATYLVLTRILRIIWNVFFCVCFRRIFMPNYVLSWRC